MSDKKKDPSNAKGASKKIKGVKVTISNDQRQIKSEQVELDVDDMIIIMPKYKSITFKKRLYWFATILYRYWN